MKPLTVSVRSTFNFDGDAYALFRLFRDQDHVFFLDSSHDDKDKGRFSFIGFSPFKIYSARGARSLANLKRDFHPFECQCSATVSPFPAGIVGFFGYDYGVSKESIPRLSYDDIQIPDCYFGFYDAVITVDRLKQQCYVTAINWDAEEKRAECEEKVRLILLRLKGLVDQKGNAPTGLFVPELFPEFHSNMSRQTFVAAVEKALQWIDEGEIYQVNLSHRYRVHLESASYQPHMLYATLREKFPSSFSAYFDAGLFKIISSSPERFLSLKDGRLMTQPMKGTRARGGTPEADAHNRTTILNDEKEKAELLMITDLMRNDLGHVCTFGSVSVERLRVVEEYKNLFQTTSTVVGHLRPEKDGF